MRLFCGFKKEISFYFYLLHTDPLLTIKYNEFMFCTSKFKAEVQVEKLPYNCRQFFSILLPIKVKVGVTSPAEE